MFQDTTPRRSQRLKNMQNMQHSPPTTSRAASTPTGSSSSVAPNSNAPPAILPAACAPANIRRAILSAADGPVSDLAVTAPPIAAHITSSAAVCSPADKGPAAATSAKTAATSAKMTATSAAATASIITPGSSVGVATPGRIEAEAATRSMNKKLEQMMSEIQRQMHAMQSVLTMNQQQVQQQVQQVQQQVHQQVQQVQQNMSDMRSELMQFRPSVQAQEAPPPLHKMPQQQFAPLQLASPSPSRPLLLPSQPPSQPLLIPSQPSSQPPSQQPLPPLHPLPVQPIQTPTAQPILTPTAQPLLAPTAQPLPAPTVQFLLPPTSQPLSTQPLSTQPLSTQPLSTQPLSTQPLSTQPLSTQPLSTQPLSTQPLSTQPLSAQPLSTQPLSTQPLSTQPLSTQPLSTQPLSTQPLSTQPLSTQPLSTQPLSTQPLSTQPLSTQPLSTQPLSTQPLSTQPLSTQPLSTQPLSTQHLPTQFWYTQPLPTQPLPAQPLPTQPMPALPLPTQPLTAQYLPAQHQPAQHQPAQHQPAQHQPAQHQRAQHQPAQCPPAQHLPAQSLPTSTPSQLLPPQHLLTQSSLHASPYSQLLSTQPSLHASPYAQLLPTQLQASPVASLLTPAQPQILQKHAQPFANYMQTQMDVQTSNQAMANSSGISEYPSNNARLVAHRQIKIYPLPIFSGLPEEWQTFSESFASTTTEFGYSALHNIMRLRDALKGRARETVESLLSHSANVSEILVILEETFGRPEQLIKSQVEKVRSIPRLAEGDLNAIVNFANRMTNMATFLKNARGEHHLSNPTLLSELVSKLPTPRQMQWAEKCITLERPPTITDFSLWLNSLRRLANMVTDSLPTTFTSYPRPAAPRKPPPAAYSAATPGRHFACVSVTPRTCAFCDGECLSLDKCTNFLRLSEADRWNIVKQQHACFSCLKKGHQANKCFVRKRCGVDSCLQIHHRLLHSASTGRQAAAEPTTPAEPPRRNDQNINETRPVAPTRTNPFRERRNCHADCGRNDSVLFQILPVKLYGNNKSITVYAFVDDGANVTMLDSDLARQLGLQGRADTLDLQWINQTTTRQKTEIVDFVISGPEEGAQKYNMSKVYTSPNLSLPHQSFKIGEFLNYGKNEHLAGLPLSDYDHIQPKIIISLTHAYLTVPVEVPRTPEGPGPIAIKTRLGWVVYGPFNDAKRSAGRALHFRKICQCDAIMKDMRDMMTSYFDAENFGIRSDVKPVRSRDEERALSILNATTKRSGERFEAGLLWREDDISFPDSFNMALHRLESIERKMARDTNYAAEYCAKLEEYVAKGYARRLSAQETQQRTTKTFYLPHFGVKNPNKKGIRLVFDAAAEINNISLNSKLLPGPDINQTLISILFKFRQAPIAVCGDIKEMFHQVCIRKDDQESQRFLWRGGNPALPLQTFVMERMTFGATCSPTIAQFVKNLNAQNFVDEMPRAVNAIVERHYVDDYVDCFRSESEALQVLQDVIAIHKAGGFEMRNIVSNSDFIMEKSGTAAALIGELVDVQGENVDRILGMFWLSKPDVFTFIFKFNKVPAEILKFERTPTKRELLSLVMSVFDPFGLLANFTIGGKILMQATWKVSLQWDDPLPPEIYRRWRMWVGELPKVEQFRIQRCYFNAFEESEVDLHIFCDASEEALAVVAYWRFAEEKSTKLVFVAAKASCAPTKYHTIPKLELQAAVLAVRLKDSIVDCHNARIRQCQFWSDSHTVIRWIRSDHRKYKQYVANRVSEILTSTKIDEWRWCPGELNPADDGTRAKFPVNYNPESRWKHGPEFLLHAENCWPDESRMGAANDCSGDELKLKRLCVVEKVSTVVPSIDRFSKYCRFRRAMAWILRFKTNLMRVLKSETVMRGELSADELGEAEIYLVRWAQREVFSCEYFHLVKSEPVSKSSDIKAFSPYLDEYGIMRTRGRIDNATCLPIAARRQMILPRKHELTRMIVDWYHRKLRHINTDTIINEVRQRFWIAALRSLVRSVAACCAFCKIRNAQPLQPQMGDLPIDRLMPYIRAFTYTGLDYFGPIHVTIGRRREKRWVALFTCLTIRAVHLEIAADLSTDACLLCIRNFVNRRGVPIQIRSDNGTNFMGIEKELQGATDFMDSDKLVAGLSPLGIKWKFNTPSNPSAGGAWERLVQSVKKALFAMLKEYAPRLETLHSLLVEAENIVNSRPLTHLAVTADDPAPLTPNHFLLGCPNSTQTPAPFEPRLLCLRKQWRILQNLKNGFWKQWIRDYLPELTRRSKWCLPVEPISVGCLVLICEEGAPRSQWRRGRIINLYHGKDGVARSAQVATTGGTLKRPVSKLAILDVQPANTGDGESPPPESIHGGGDVANGNPIGE